IRNIGMEALFAALWLAGTGLVVIAGLSRLSFWWKERRRRRTLLEPAQEGVRRSPLREIAIIHRLSDDMDIAGIRLPVEAMIALMLVIGTFGWFAVDLSIISMQ